MAIRTRWVRTAALLSMLAVTTACGASGPTNPGGPPGPGTASLQFTHVPVAYSASTGTFGVSQAGYHSVSGNPIRPYLDFFSGGPAAGDTSIFAPAGGTVVATSLDSESGRMRLDVMAAGGYRYYLTGPGVTFSVGAGTTIAAGQTIGVRQGEFRQGASSVGLGVIHPTRRVGFVSPDRYADELLRAVSPLDFYTEPLRGLLTGALQPGNASFELNYDIPGRLQGFWYLPSIPRSQSTARAHSAGWLWFHKTINAQRLGLSGFSIVAPSPQGQSTNYDLISDSGPAFADVSPASGVVTYRFPYWSGNAIVLRVEMLSETSVRAETFDTHDGLPAGFTANAKVYIR